jgi:iron-sulfur cluster repair protein YtfE (RIC family)
MTQGVLDVRPEMTVNEIVQKYPQALPVFKELGIDTCCGGAQPLGVVLVKHKLDDASVMDALQKAVS